MPTYVYACNQCEHRFEVFQSFTDKALRQCPECGHKALRKVLFPAGVVFKGSGFYVNDSRSASATTPGEKRPTDKEKAGTATSNSNGEKSKSDRSSKADSLSSNSDRGKQTVSSGTGGKS